MVLLDDDLADGAFESWVDEGICKLETLLASHMGFHRYLAERDFGA